MALHGSRLNRLPLRPSHLRGTLLFRPWTVNSGASVTLAPMRFLTRHLQRHTARQRPAGARLDVRVHPLTRIRIREINPGKELLALCAPPRAVTSGRASAGPAGCSLDGNAALNRRVAPRSKIGTLSGAADRPAATDRSARLAELSSTPPWTQLWIDTGNRYHTPRAIPDPSDTQLIGLGLPIGHQRTCRGQPRPDKTGVPCTSRQIRDRCPPPPATWLY